MYMRLIGRVYLRNINTCQSTSFQWVLKYFFYDLKSQLNYSVHELFIFKILLIAIDWNC